MTEQGLPNWAREVLTLLPACAHFLLLETVQTQYFATDTAPTALGSNSRVLRPLPFLLAEALNDQGVETAVLYDISKGVEILSYAEGAAERADALGRSSKGAQ